MIDPSTGAILAMASTPTFDPTPLVSTDTKAANAALFADNLKDSEGFAPIYPMATYNPIQPGSTVKVVTIAAIYNLRPGLASYNYPVSSCQPLPDSDKQICNQAVCRSSIERESRYSSGT
jgi:peptidoglycan glycosyltransferase